MRRVRILISSPGDVSTERENARQIVERLQARYTGRLRLETVLWESLPLVATTSFQEGIDGVVLDGEHGIDIAIFILWSRLGSPLGSAIKRPDGGEYRSGTEREFDLMVSAYEQSGHTRPDILAYVREDDTAFSNLLLAAGDDQRLELIQQKQLAKNFIKESFRDAKTGTNIGAYHTFDHPASFATRLRVHLQTILDQMLADSPDVAWDVAEHGPPYRGLQAYDVDHGPIYFGREQEICELQETLQRQARVGNGFVLVVGASGSGKSSLVRAGLIPALQHFEFDDGVATWRHATFVPGESGDSLFAGLAHTLAGPSALPELADGMTDKLAEYLRRDTAAACDLILAVAMNEASRSLGGELRLLVLVDQLEEIFTHAHVTEELPQAFMAALITLASMPQVRVVVTVRSDFYADCMGLTSMMQVINRGGIMNLLAPQPESIAQMIRQPAHLAGLRFGTTTSGRGLDTTVLHDALEEPDALPLLADLLRELYERREGNVLTPASYADLGGVAGALGKRAETAYQGLPADAQRALSAVLQDLVTIREDDQQLVPMRHRVRMEEAANTPAKKTVVETFVAARLFTADRDGAGRPVLSVAHEKLLVAWDRAVTWIDENRDFLRLRARMATAAGRWDSEGRTPDFLIPAGRQMADTAALLERRSDLPTVVVEYIEASQRLHAGRRRRTGVVIALLVALLAAAGIAGTSARRQTLDARRSAELAYKAALRAEVEAARAQNAELRAREQTERAAAAEQHIERDMVYFAAVINGLINLAERITPGTITDNDSDSTKTSTVTCELGLIEIEGHSKIHDFILGDYLGEVRYMDPSTNQLVTITVRDFVYDSVTGPFSVLDFDRVLVHSGIRTTEIVKHSDGSVEVTLQYSIEEPVESTGQGTHETIKTEVRVLTVVGMAAPRTDESPARPD